MRVTEDLALWLNPNDDFFIYWYLNNHGLGGDDDWYSATQALYQVFSSLTPWPYVHIAIGYKKCFFPFWLSFLHAALLSIYHMGFPAMSTCHNVNSAVSRHQIEKKDHGLSNNGYGYHESLWWQCILYCIAPNRHAGGRDSTHFNPVL